MENQQSQPVSSTAAELTVLGLLIRKALEASSRGQHLSPSERNTLSLWLKGESWFTKRESGGLEEAKTIRAQTIILGKDLRRALENAVSDGQLTREDRRELHEWLYSARRLQRRYQRRRWLYYLLYTFGILVATLFIRPHIPVEGLKAHPLWIPFFLATGILLVAIIKDVFLDRNVETALSDIKWVAEKTKEDVRDILEKDLRPRIIALDGRDAVLRAASEILSEAIQESPDHRFVIFIGAASLSAQSSEPHKDEDTMSPAEEYNTRLLNLEGARVPVKRYVAMIDPKDFLKRKPETRRQYFQWFEKQMSLLKDNTKYSLIDCPRAQAWGSSRSSIVTRKAFLDIVGEGEAGFLIKGEEIASTLKDSSEKLFAAANQHLYKGGEDQTMADLEEIKENLKKKL